jgi:hypothetical protein
MKAVKFSFYKDRWRFPRFDLDELRFTLTAENLRPIVRGIGNAKTPYKDLGGWQNQVDVEREGDVRDFVQVIDDLIGVRGMARPSENEFDEHVKFLQESRPHRWNVKRVVKDFEKNHHLRLTDLASICDATILYPYISSPGKPVRVLEIGGGYGRLAESLIGNVNAKLEIDMVDVVPSSLLLANQYLTKAGVDCHVQISTEPSVCKQVTLRGPSGCDFIEDGSVDLAINVESFQEMTQEWVDYWIKLINRSTHKGSLFYHSNSLGYKNLYTLEMGADWRILESYHHPRHWTNSHRTEIWERIR